jgi:phasin family protein
MARSATSPEDITKAFEQFKVPGFDVTAFVAARRKDIEAAITANKMAQENVQALALKQVEMFEQSLQQVQDAAKAMATNSAPDKSAEQAQKAYTKALGDMRELAEMANRSSANAMELLNQRAAQNMEALKEFLRPKA